MGLLDQLFKKFKIPLGPNALKWVQKGYFLAQKHDFSPFGHFYAGNKRRG